MLLELPRSSFSTRAPLAPSLLKALNAALDQDLDYTVPPLYALAAGSTYEGGKCLAKLGRLALIAEELGRRGDALALAKRLGDLLEVRLLAGADWLAMIGDDGVGVALLGFKAWSLYHGWSARAPRVNL